MLHYASFHLGHHCLQVSGMKRVHHFLWTLANRADPDQTPQNAASDQGLHCMLTKCFFFFLNLNEKTPTLTTKIDWDN